MQEPVLNQELYRGKIVTLRVLTLAEPIGGVTQFEVVDHSDAVAVVAAQRERADDPKSPWVVALVRQDRPAIRQQTWELPAGLVRPEELADYRYTAIRELREETGYSASNWIQLGREHTSPGFTNEAISIYLATGLRRSEEAAPAADPAYHEISEVRWLRLDDALTLCRNGTITDGKTMLGLYLARDALERDTAPAGEAAMPRDNLNIPLPRAISFRDDAPATDEPLLSASPTLRIDNMLLEEFNYASLTAYQAMEDRARMFNLYLIIVGILASGLGAVYQIGGAQRVYTQPLALALLCVAGVMGVAFLVQLIRLRQAYRESLIAMNVVKEYYIENVKSVRPDIDKAFRWRLTTIPTGERFGSVTFVICMTVALLDSLSFGAGAIVAYEIWSGALSSNLLAIPLGLQPWVIGFGVFLIVLGAQVISYYVALRKRKERKTLVQQAKKLNLPLPEPLQHELAREQKHERRERRES